MIRIVINAMIFIGAALMVYNIYGFVKFVRYVKQQQTWKRGNAILYLPVALLVFFLLGYIFVGLFGKPDIMMAGILLGGSIFVFVIYTFLYSIIQSLMENEKLEVQRLSAIESNRAKTEFLASISHEMRTPMNVILGLDNVALQSPDLPEETRGHLEKIKQSGKHLLDLINNVIEINDIEKNGYELHRERFSLDEAVDQLNVIVNTMCEDRALNYRCEMGENVSGFYMGDAVELKQVLFSFLDNAVKYTDSPGSVSMDIRSISEDKGIRRLEFLITDTGIGMSKDFLDRIFTPFAQEDSSFTSRYGGSGLSLALTKEKVSRMGGTISVKSVKNYGSEFTIVIPLELSEEQAEAGGSLVSLEGKRILVVDDIKDNAEIVIDLLDLEGAVSEHAENGKIALDMFAASEPYYYDAILMDLRMPVMDGHESAQMIRALDREDAKTVPIIALTANAYANDVQKSFEVGMDEHLTKPVDTDILYEALKEQIGKREAEKKQ